MVLTARDKVYAHWDPSAEVLNTTSDEINHLVKVANEVQNDFTFHIFHGSTRFEESDSWEIDPVLWTMSEMRAKDLEELERKKGGR